jgi:hypothetical protein
VATSYLVATAGLVAVVPRAIRKIRRRSPAMYLPAGA